jgi:hypothetical protein
MFVIIFTFYNSFSDLCSCAEIFPGRDRDYLNLNVTYAANVVKFGMIISWFPKPFKLCVTVVTPARVTLSLNIL